MISGKEAHCGGGILGVSRWEAWLTADLIVRL